jgi:hypothetical protein
MTVLTNTFGVGPETNLTQAVGIREDLTDVIYDISPTETPFMSNIGKTKATTTLHEWQTDSLRAAASNAQVEGDDYDSRGYNVADGSGVEALGATTRVSNSTQIAAKTLIVSGTHESTLKAGRKSEIAYQVAKKGKELKRDMEFDLSQENEQVISTGTTAPRSRGLEHWIQTNGSQGTSYSYTNGTTTLTDGTQRDLTEAMFKEAVNEAWVAGGDPECALCGPVNKQNISSQFSGIATIYREQSGVNPATIVGAADVYVSDFGELKIVPSRFSRDRTISIIQKDMWAVAYLRPFKIWELAKTGDAEKRLLLAEYTLECRNEAANSKVADLNTSIL